MRAALARDTSAALAAGSESHAVEGYVPRNSPGIAATVAPRAVVPVDSAKSDSNMSQGPPLDAAPSSEQGSSTAGSVEQHNIPAEASPPAGHNTSQRSAAAAGKPEAKTNATQSFVNGIQDVSASSGSSSQASSLSADAQTPAQDRRRVAEDDKELDRCGATGQRQGEAPAACERHGKKRFSKPAMPKVPQRRSILLQRVSPARQQTRHSSLFWYVCIPCLCAGTYLMHQDVSMCPCRVCDVLLSDWAWQWTFAACSAGV